MSKDNRLLTIVPPSLTFFGQNSNRYNVGLSVSRVLRFMRIVVDALVSVVPNRASLFRGIFSRHPTFANNQRTFDPTQEQIIGRAK